MSGAEIFTRLRLLLYSTLTTTMTMGRGRGLSRNLPGAGKVKHDRRRQPWPQQTKNLLQLLCRHKVQAAPDFWPFTPIHMHIYCTRVRLVKNYVPDVSGQEQTN